jgi:small-conductance mechanosensitive channel
MPVDGLLQLGTIETLLGSGEAVRAYWKTAPLVVRVLVGLVIVGVGAYLSKFLVRLLGRPVARRFQRQSVAQTVLAGIRVSTVLVFSVLAASAIGLQLGDIVLSVTVFSAVLGIVLAPIVGSIINGVFVLADQPYEIGDMIELGDTRGFVDDITLRYTKIFTLDNTFIVLSNSTIREREVTNFSAEDERTRLSLKLLVTYECDIEQARKILERAARDCDDVVEGGPDIRIGSGRYPAKPTCLIEEYADHGVLLNLRFWTRTPYKIPRVRSDVQEAVWSMLDDADVEIAYPHQHLLFDETSGQARVAVENASRTWASGGSAPTPPTEDEVADADE